MVVPVIDFSKLNGEERAATMAQIHNGCQEWGFFQLVNHGIPEDLLERVKKVSTECFKQEREEGFKKSKPVNRLKELNDSNNGDKIEDLDWEDVFLLTDGNTAEWPSNTPSFRETMAEYRAEIKKLAEKMMGIMEENLGLPEGYIKSAFDNAANSSTDSAFFGTKVSHYPPCPEPDRVWGLRAHTDAGGVILLFQDDQVGGLQMLKTSDNQWVDVQPLANAIVINTGDQIEVLSNGKYKSAWHRVKAMPDQTRRSIASFYNPSYNAAISPAPQLVEAAEKVDVVVDEVKYPKFLFGDYMSVYAEQKYLPKEPRFQAVVKAM